MLRKLAAVVLLISTVAWPGGVVGNGRFVPEARQPESDARPGFPQKPGRKAGQKYRFPLGNIGFSSHEVNEGEALVVRVQVPLVTGGPVVSHCSGTLVSPDLQESFVSFDSCEVEKVEGRLAWLALSVRFPSPTLSRIYYLNSVEWAESNPELGRFARYEGTPKQEVNSSVSVRGSLIGPTIRPEAVFLEKAGEKLTPGEVFTLVVRGESPGTILGARLSFHFDQGDGVEWGTLPLVVGQKQAEDDWVRNVDVTFKSGEDASSGRFELRAALRVPEAYVFARRIQIKRVLLLNEALEEVAIELESGVEAEFASTPAYQ